MKTFEDLEFNTHPNAMIGFDTQAIMEFPNGWGLSVLNGEFAYCDNETFEVAILWHGELDYSTEITDDVLRYQTPGEITEVMRKLQEMKPKEN